MRTKKCPGAAPAAAEARKKNQQSANHIETPAGVQGRPTEAAIYVIRLRSTRSGDDIRHLRAILKVLLRRYSLRCLSIEPKAMP